MHSKIFNFLFLTATFALLFASCGKSSDSDPDPEPEPQTDEVFQILSRTSQTSVWNQSETIPLKFYTDCQWRILIQDSDSWIMVDKSFSSRPSKGTEYTVNISFKRNTSGKSRKGALKITYGSESKVATVNVTQYGMPVISTSKVTEDMFFSTCCAKSTTAVQQGFEYDPETDMVFFSQLNNAYRNYISWRKRVPLTTSTEKAANSMTLMYFSHGNNIHIDKDEKGDYYVWIANHGSRNDNDGKYRYGQVISRVKLESGKTVRSFETTENYYFGTHNIHASFDTKNDRLALYSCSVEDDYNLSVYKLSDVLAAPEKTLKLKYEIVRGGMTSPDTEWRGQPEVKVHDCRDIKPLHSFRYNYSEYGRGWQTIYLSGDRIYYFLCYATPQNGRPYQSVMDISDLDGNMIKKDILFPFSDNWQGLAEFGYGESDATYLENEAMIIRDGVAYFSFSTQGNNDGIRRPLVFNFAADSLE